MADRVEEYFALVDADGDGVIDRPEFSRLLNRLGVNRSETVVGRVFESIDIDGNGHIDLTEFSRWWASVESR